MSSPSSAGNRLPTYQREIAELRREIRELRQLLNARADFPAIGGQMPFSWSDLVSGAKLSGPWNVALELTVTGFLTDYTTTSSADTFLDFYVNGVIAHSWTHGAGVETLFTPVRFIVPQGARCQLAVDGVDGYEFTCFVGYYQRRVG
jgi:hypothetical protein